MPDEHSFGDRLHRATHRIPGVPAHAERPAGHHGAAEHAHAPQPAPAHERTHDWSHKRNHGRTHSRHHAPARPPRFLPAWQRRVAAFFGQEV